MHQQWQLRRAEPTFGRKRANKLDASRAGRRLRLADALAALHCFKLSKTGAISTVAAGSNKACWRGAPIWMQYTTVSDCRQCRQWPVGLGMIRGMCTLQ